MPHPDSAPCTVGLYSSAKGGLAEWQAVLSLSIRVTVVLAADLMSAPSVSFRVQQDLALKPIFSNVRGTQHCLRLYHHVKV